MDICGFFDSDLDSSSDEQSLPIVEDDFAAGFGEAAFLHPTTVDSGDESDADEHDQVHMLLEEYDFQSYNMIIVFVLRPGLAIYRAMKKSASR